MIYTNSILLRIVKVYNKYQKMNGGMIMDLLAGEFLTYLFKYIVLGVIAIAGVLCGVKYKKNKLAKKTAIDEALQTEE